MSSECLVLFAHGSNDPKWKWPFERLTQRLQERLGRPAVKLAFLQMAEPTLAEMVAEAAGQGADVVKVLPLFLAAGAHVEQDIPSQVQDAQAATPSVKVHLLPAVGTDPRVGDLLTTLALEAASAAPSSM